MNKGKLLLAIGCSLLAVLNSCKEDTGNVGANLLPKSDLIGAAQTDTAAIVTSMYFKDSVETNATILSVLGGFNDPVFGVTKASIYAEVSPCSGTGISWYSSSSIHNYQYTVDSAVLLLPLSGSPYGNLDAQTFLVYTLDSNIYADSAYYSNKTFKFKSPNPLCPELIGSAQVTPQNAAVSVNDTLRIKLKSSFLNYLEQQVYPGNNWTTTFNTNVIRGICITTDNPLQLPGQGAMLYVNLNNNFGGIYVYYHIDSNATIPYYAFFPIGANGAYFSNITNNYATSPLNAIRPKGPRDSVPAGQLVYVQSLGGVSGRINFPNLYKNWSKLGPVVINEAVVNMPINQQDVSVAFPPPTTLFLIPTDSAWGTSNQTAYGSNSVGSSYSFIITQYIQSVIDGKTIDRGMYLVPGNSSIAANSVVMYGAQYGMVPANKTSLTIYYTPLKTAAKAP